jgi:hypothetical protein
VAVEAALVLPLLVLLFVGTVDLSFFLRDHVSATSLTRSGARVAASLPRFGTDLPSSTANPWGHAGIGVTSSFAQAAADAMQRAGTALPKNAIDFIWVYRPTADGFPENGNDDFSSCPPTSCAIYRWVDGSPGRFTYQPQLGGAWSPRGINSCLGDEDAQSVGVYIQATHTWLFGVLGSPTSTVSARTVMKFEPRTVFDDESQPTSSAPGWFAGCS